MPLPVLPVFPSDDSLHQQSERYRHYLTRFRAELEGQEFGLPNFIEQGQQWGVLPPPAGNLIIDPGFELNRSAWLLPLGARIAEDVNALAGHYVLLMTSAEGYANGFLIANAGTYTPCIAGQLLALLGHVVGGSGSTGTATATIQFYDANKTIISTAGGTGISLTTGWQVVVSKAVVPATAVYARFGFAIASLSGQAGWDDTLALAVRSQNEMAESTGQVTFSSTTETILSSVTMGPVAQVPIGGTASVITPVMITANCAYVAAAGAGGSLTFRIRRTNVSGAALATFTNLTGVTTFYGTAFDTAPTVTAETWVLTGQMADGTGGATGQHRMWASQHYN